MVGACEAVCNHIDVFQKTSMYGNQRVFAHTHNPNTDTTPLAIATCEGGSETLGGAQLAAGVAWGSVTAPAGVGPATGTLY